MATKKTSSPSTGRRTWNPSSPSGYTHGPKGLMGSKEKQMLAIAARQAFDNQLRLQRVEPGQSFDEWRHEQVQDKTGKPGLRACAHGDFRPLLAWFQQLAGHEAESLATHLRTGRVKDHGPADDTHEARGKIVAEIRGRLAAHILLHDLAWLDLLDRWTRASGCSSTPRSATRASARPSRCPGCASGSSGRRSGAWSRRSATATSSARARRSRSTRRPDA
jgi:hypothetical protein